MRERRAAKSGRDPVGRPKRKVSMRKQPREQRLKPMAEIFHGINTGNVIPPQDFANAVATPQKRLAFMMSRHEQTLADFNQLRHVLDQRIEEFAKSGMINDYKFFLKQRQDLIKSAGEYDLRMSKELQVWNEFAQQGDVETPIEFQLVAPPPMESLIVPTIGDRLDLSSLMPDDVN